MTWQNTRTGAFPADSETLTSRSLLFASSVSAFNVVVHWFVLQLFSVHSSHRTFTVFFPCIPWFSLRSCVLRVDLVDDVTVVIFHLKGREQPGIEHRLTPPRAPNSS